MRALRLALPMLLVAGTAAAAEPGPDGPTAPASPSAPTAAPSPPPTPAPAPTAEPAPAPTAEPAAASPVAADAPLAPAAAAAAKPWRFTGTLGVVSLPRVLSVEALARRRRAEDPRWDLVALGLGFDYLPPGLANFGDKTKLSWMLVGAEARWFPWRWLFAGARVGYMYTRADSEKFGSALDYVTRSFALAPKVGALYTFSSGLTIGGDLGATIPIAASTSLDSDGTSDSNARKVAKTFGMFVMPALAFRLGYTL